MELEVEVVGCLGFMADFFLFLGAYAGGDLFREICITTCRNV